MKLCRILNVGLLGILVFLIILCWGGVTPKPVEGTLKYRVFCVEGMIEVGSRTLAEMRAARGENVCQLYEFGTQSQAAEAARKAGGLGGSCGDINKKCGSTN